MVNKTSLAILAALSFASCTIDDDDRCTEGYFWCAQYSGCLPITDAGEVGCGTGADTDTDADTDSDSDADTDADADSDSGTGDSGPVDTGLGVTCTSDTDCAGYEADYCVISPLAPSDPGYCTYDDCTAGSCPDAFQCCDCSELGYWIACVTDADAETASAFCTCN